MVLWILTAAPLRRAMLSLALAAFLSGCGLIESPGVTPPIIGSDGTVFEGGELTLTYARSILLHAARGFEQLAAGAGGRLCEPPEPGATFEVLRTPLYEASSTQRNECEAMLRNSAAELVDAIRNHPPVFELRVGPLTVPWQGGTVEVTAKTEPHLGAKIYLDARKVLTMPVPVLAAVLIHELLHQITHLRDAAARRYFANVRHFFDVVAAGAAVHLYRDLAPSASLALARVASDRFVLLGLGAGGAATGRVIQIDAAGTVSVQGPWQPLAVGESWNQLSAVNGVAGSSVLLGLDGDGRVAHARLDGLDPMGTTAWTRLPAVTEQDRITQFSAAVFGDRVVVAGLYGATKRVALFSLRILPSGDLEPSTEWRPTQLSGVNRIDLGTLTEAGAAKLWLVGTYAENLDTHYFARASSLAQAETVTWERFGGGTVTATAQAVYDPGTPESSFQILQGARSYVLRHRTFELRMLAVMDDVWNPPTTAPLTNVGWTRFSPRSTLGLTAALLDTGGMLVAAFAPTGQILAAMSNDARLYFPENWVDVGFSMAVANRFAAGSTGNIDVKRCVRNPRMEGLRATWVNALAFHRDLIWINENCLNSAGTLLAHYRFKINGTKQGSGSFTPIASAAASVTGTECRMVVTNNQCPRYPSRQADHAIYPNQGYFLPNVVPWDKAVCLFVAFGHAMQCEAGDAPRLNVTYRDAQRRRASYDFSISDLPRQ